MTAPGTIGIILLSVKIGLAATLVNLPAAMAVAYIMTRRDFPGKAVLDGLVNLPLVMPPVTTGYVLLLILGKRGFIGSALYSLFGVRIAFTQTAAVIASMVVSFPLITRSIRISMEMIDRKLEQAALTLGAGRPAVFFRVSLPLVLPGVASGTILGFARSLGEFGATITFAGNIAGETRTIPLAVHSLLQVPGKESEAGRLVFASITISFLAMALSSAIGKRHRASKEHGIGPSV